MGFGLDGYHDTTHDSWIGNEDDVWKLSPYIQVISIVLQTDSYYFRTSLLQISKKSLFVLCFLIPNLINRKGNGKLTKKWRDLQMKVLTNTETWSISAITDAFLDQMWTCTYLHCPFTYIYLFWSKKTSVIAEIFQVSMCTFIWRSLRFLVSFPFSNYWVIHTSVVSFPHGLIQNLFIYLYRRVMVILDVKVLVVGSEVGFKIGNPRPITESNETESSGPARQTPAARPNPPKRK